MDGSTVIRPGARSQVLASMCSNSRSAMAVLVAASNSGVISAWVLWTLPSVMSFLSVAGESSDGLAQIGGLDVRAVADVVGGALEDRPAEVDDVDPLAQRQHEVHVVLHQQESDVVLVHDPAQDRPEAGALDGVEARRRL